jgi:ACT domain-containing protein
MEKQQAIETFGKERVNWTKEKCVEQIEFFRTEITKYKRGVDTMWNLYHQEITTLHLLLKHIKDENEKNRLHIA